MIKEIWKSIPNFEGLYEVSNTGKIKSIERLKVNHGKTQRVPEKMKNVRKDPQGYHQMDLYKNNKQKTVRVHRIVAEVFIDNPENKPTVNHKDGNKDNNHENNLEWSTFKEQNEHFYKNKLKSEKNIKKAVRAMNKSQAKKTRCINTGVIYESASDAGRKNNISPSLIMSVCRNEKGNKTAGGFKWEYVE